MKKYYVIILCFIFFCLEVSLSQENSIRIIPNLEVGSCIKYQSSYQIIKFLKIISINPENPENIILANSFVNSSSPLLGNLFSEANENYQICAIRLDKDSFDFTIKGIVLYFNPDKSISHPNYSKNEFEATIKVFDGSQSIIFNKYIYENSNLLSEINKDSSDMRSFRNSWINERFFNIFYKEIDSSTRLVDKKIRMPFRYLCVLRECAGYDYGDFTTAKMTGFDENEIRFDLVYPAKELNVAYTETNKIKVFESWKPSIGAGNLVFSKTGFIKKSQSNFFINGLNTYILPTKSKPVTLKILQQYRISESTVEIK
jgi:hypothetical protein